MTVCARDARSAELLEQILPGRVILAPDMAFFVDVAQWRRGGNGAPAGRVLHAQRHDKEARADSLPADLPAGAVTADWPQMEALSGQFERDYQRRLRWAYRLRRLTGIDRVTGFRDRYYRDRQRPATLRQAVRWLDGFDSVWSTRLHISLLAILLGKDVHVIDNSYRKATNLLDTWFKP